MNFAELFGDHETATWWEVGAAERAISYQLRIVVRDAVREPLWVSHEHALWRVVISAREGLSWNLLKL